MTQEQVKILLVEDNPGDALLFREMLNEYRGFTEEHVDRLSAALERLGGGGIDIVLLDLSLPDSHGPDTYLKLKAAFPDVPLILLTGLNDIEFSRLAIREGVQDYLVKGLVNSIWLGSTIRHAIERKQSELILRKSEQAVSKSAKMAAVGELAAGIAHDFNNMLSVILNVSEMMFTDKSLSPRTTEQIRMIQEVSERASNLTKQLLTFSKKAPGKPAITDVNEIIAGMNEMLRTTVGKKIRFSTDLDEHISKIKIDITQLEQVIMNLCINARDAMPDGGNLNIRTKETRSSEGSEILLSVEDTGQGMSEQVKGRIFEPYFTTKEPGKGTGLGLATVFGIVEQANGRIEVRSEVGKGASFDIYFKSA
jgi:signal transduction histidine kinase